MNKPDEISFMRLLLANLEPRKTPYQLRGEPGFPANEKRAMFLLLKWSGKDWYNYGVSPYHGWLETEGIIAFEEILARLPKV